MNSQLEEAQTDVPLLSSKHSGIPAPLLEKACAIKEDTFSQRTKPLNPRKRLPVVPKGIEESQFLAALDDLRGILGAENVEVNDKPLRDGWYMERERATHMTKNLAVIWLMMREQIQIRMI